MKSQKLLVTYSKRKAHILKVTTPSCFLGIPYSAKFSRAVNFADFANSNSIAKIIFVKITIFDLLRPKLILTTNVACVVNKKPHPAHVKMAVPRALLK